MRRPNSEELIRAHKNLSTLLVAMLENPTNEHNLESIAAGFLEVSYCNSPLVSGEKAQISVREMVEKTKDIWKLAQETLMNESLGYSITAPMYILMKELYVSALNGRIADLGKYHRTDNITEEKEKDHNDKLERAYTVTSNYIKSIVGASQVSRSINRFNKKNNRDENPLELVSPTTMFQVFNYYNELEQSPDIGLRESALPIFLECMVTFNNDRLSDTPISDVSKEESFTGNYQKIKEFVTAKKA